MQKVFIGIALIVSLVFTTSPITRAESTSTPIRLASFNMLTYRPNNDRTPTSWDAPDFRKNLIIKTIVDNNWDVAGLQEVSGAFRRNDNTFTLSQLEFVKNNLESAGYTLVNSEYDGCSASWSTDPTTTYKPYNNPIVFKTAKYSMLGNGCFSISSEPTNLFKKDYGLPRPLIATWLKLEDKTSHQQFYLFNSHLSYEDEFVGSDGNIGTATPAERAAYSLQQARSLMNSVSRIVSGSNLPMFLTGDYNAKDGSPTLTNGILSSDFSDAYALAENKAFDNNTRSSYNGFSLSRELSYGENRIDHIFASNGKNITINTYRIVSTKYGNSYASDHNAIQADAVIASSATPNPSGVPTGTNTRKSTIKPPNTGARVVQSTIPTIIIAIISITLLATARKK